LNCFPQKEGLSDNCVAPSQENYLPYVVDYVQPLQDWSTHRLAAVEELLV